MKWMHNIGMLSIAVVLTSCMSDGNDKQPNDHSSESTSTQEIAEQANGTDSTSAQRCEKLDLLFAVDNSGSMQDEKQALRDHVFPRFAESLLSPDRVAIKHFNVGITDACPTDSNMHNYGEDPNDEDASVSCGFAADKTYTSSDSENLVSEFQCAGYVYSEFGGQGQCTGDNDDEQPVNAAHAALLETGNDAINAGFMRDDAVLVIVALTDEDEKPGKTVDQLYQDIINLKGSEARKRVVLLGIGGSSSCNYTLSGSDQTADEAIFLKELTQKFSDDGRGVFWDLCEGNLDQGAGLEQALDIITTACDELPEQPPVDVY